MKDKKFSHKQETESATMVTAQTPPQKMASKFNMWAEMLKKRKE